MPLVDNENSPKPTKLPPVPPPATLRRRDKSLGVEGLRHQRPVAQEQDVPPGDLPVADIPRRSLHCQSRRRTLLLGCGHPAILGKFRFSRPSAIRNTGSDGHPAGTTERMERLPLQLRDRTALPPASGTFRTGPMPLPPNTITPILVPGASAPCLRTRIKSAEARPQRPSS